MTPNKTSNLVQYHKDYAKANNQRIRKNRRDWTRRVREETIKRYGGMCVCCGESLPELLKVSPGPAQSKAPPKMSIYYWLRKLGYPEGYIVRCASCAFAVENRGFCPHAQGAV